MSTSQYLTDRQRAAPPINRTSARRGIAPGGIDRADPRTLAPGLESEVARYPGTVFDGGIVRDRGAYYQQPRYMPPPQSWVNWTEAGPTRPELHGRNASLRTMQGNTESRYPTVNSPTGGLHTMIPSGPGGSEQTPGRYASVQQMRYARTDRLQPGQYRGQSYSQGTALQGSRPR